MSSELLNPLKPSQRNVHVPSGVNLEFNGLTGQLVNVIQHCFFHCCINLWTFCGTGACMSLMDTTLQRLRGTGKSETSIGDLGLGKEDGPGAG